MKIDKLPKGNRIFETDPKVLEFIEYCKKTYSDKIRNINLTLYDEEDASGNEWQLNVSECSENNIQGLVWAEWFIPTNNSIIYDKLKEKYTDEEIAESHIFPSEKSREEQEKDAKEFSKFVKQQRKLNDKT
jgi:hypothetical protein